MTSRFLMVKCKCGNEQAVFSSTSMKANCRGCNELLAEPQGGDANILGRVVKVLG